MFKDLDLAAILNEKVRELVKRLLNMIEELSAGLREENQRLRDEGNRLKDEQGKLTIKISMGQADKAGQAKDHSSEKEWHKPRKRHNRKKNAVLVIERDTCACA